MSDRNLFTAKELKERLKQNNNRGTTSPYLLFLQERRTYIAHDEFNSGTKTKYYSDLMEMASDSKEEIIKNIKDYYDDCDEDDSLTKRKVEEAIEQIRQFEEGGYWETVNVFLTDKGYEDHMKANGHNIREHRTYGYHAFRNKEIASLLAILDKAAEEENIKDSNE